MSDSMRHQGILEEPVHTDDYEDEPEKWKTVGDLRFSLRASQGSDTDSDLQVDHVLKFDVRTRYRGDIKSGQRINMGGRYLNIVGLPIDKDQRLRWLELTCEELVE